LHVILFLQMLLRYVFDTNVLVAALRSDRGASRRLLLSALKGEIQAIVSVPLSIEYEAVLTRPDQLEATETNAVLDALIAVADPVLLWFLWRPRLVDPADEMVLETAVNGRADCLVSFNLNHFKSAGKRNFKLLPRFWAAAGVVA
jgi:putative PIN family toxin of toxin-antitoxin system